MFANDHSKSNGALQSLSQIRLVSNTSSLQCPLNKNWVSLQKPLKNAL